VKTILRKNSGGKLTPLSTLFSLQGKRALITGSATGIGKAIAYRLAEAGASLDLVDINDEQLGMVKDELTAFAVETRLHKTDLSRHLEITRLWEELDGTEPDILVNNAGVYPFKDFLDVDEAFLDRIMEINLKSVFWMCQQMIKRRSSKGGVIINIGSIEAILPFKDDLTHYNMSKAGVLALTRALAKEYGKQGFRINAIIPGGIITSGTKNKAKEILKLNLGLIKSGIDFKTRLPLGRFGHPDEVALMALVLATELSSYVQGALLPVDGGFLSS
jgi:NAD(P)-dependent dehydrogenase (short-subunit alcohol dehydrogenase family)